MTVTLAPAFYDREFTWLWLEVVCHTEKLLNEYGLAEYNVLISSLPLGKDELQKARLKRIVNDLRQETDRKEWPGAGNELCSASLVGRRFEIMVDPSYVIEDPKKYAGTIIFDTLQSLRFKRGMESNEDQD